LEWFKELTREDKYKYISRYHQLTKEQRSLVFEDPILLKSYLSTGNPLETDEVKRLNSTQRSIYKHAREKILKETKYKAVLSDNILFEQNMLEGKDLNYALEYASENNNLETVKYLVEKGATELNNSYIMLLEIII